MIIAFVIGLIVGSTVGIAGMAVLFYRSSGQIEYELAEWKRKHNIQIPGPDFENRNRD